MGKENALLQVQNLKKYFKTAKGQLHAVDDITFSLERGKTLGVVGESGCGKSTLGRTILNLLPATSGEVIFDGVHVENADRRQMRKLRQEMQIIFQDPFSSLDPRLSVSEIIMEPLEIYKIGSGRQERQKRVEELMDTVGLARRLVNSYPHELDGGRRQRIDVARALALNPKFIVCDEPVSALDVSIQAQILNLMQDLQEQHGLAYMFITHDLSVVKHISDDILVMYLGKMVEKCPAKELFRNHMHPYTGALLSAISVPEIGAAKNRVLLQGELSSPINPKPGCRFANRCVYASELCFQKEPDLEEVVPGHFVACHHVKEIKGKEVIG